MRTRKNLHSLLLGIALLSLAYTPAKAETLYYDDSVYNGGVAGRNPHGQGTMKWADGHKYAGDYLNGKRHGQGSLSWPDGDKYVGEFKNDKRHG